MLLVLNENFNTKIIAKDFALFFREKIKDE